MRSKPVSYAVRERLDNVLLCLGRATNYYFRRLDCCRTAVPDTVLIAVKTMRKFLDSLCRTRVRSTCFARFVREYLPSDQASDWLASATPPDRALDFINQSVEMLEFVGQH
jgi:hypothetical protein